MDFLTAAERIKELNHPTDPLEKYSLGEAKFQELLAAHQDNQEVMMLAQKVSFFGAPGQSGSYLAQKVVVCYVVVQGTTTVLLCEVGEGVWREWGGRDGRVYLSSTHGGSVPLTEFLRDNPPILPNGESLSWRSNDHRRENNRSQ